MYRPLAIVPYIPFLKKRYSYSSLLTRLIYLDYADMPGLTKQDEGLHKDWVPVFRKSPWSARYLVDGDLNILGYWHFVALKEPYYRKARKGLLLDSNITADRIYALDRKGHYNMYFVETVLQPELRDTDAIVMLDDSFYDAIYDFARSGVFFKERITNAITDAGVRRATGLGMKYMTRNISRGSIYRMNFVDFLLRNAERRTDVLKLYAKEMERDRGAQEERLY